MQSKQNKDKKHGTAKFKKGGRPNQPLSTAKLQQSAIEAKTKKIDMRMRYAAAAFQSEGGRSLFSGVGPTDEDAKKGEAPPPGQGSKL